MPGEPEVDEIVATGWANIFNQPGPVIVAPGVPLVTLSPLSVEQLTAFGNWLLRIAQTSVIPPIAGLDPIQAQGDSP